MAMEGKDKAKPWYSGGLRFQCTQCGDCCTGSEGFVWVNKAEIAALAIRTGLTVSEFEEQYVRLVGIRKSLREREGGDCVLLDPHTRHCLAYDDRPRQCRTWPFWDSNLSSPDAWEEASQQCPGCNKGNLVPLELIVAQAAQIKI
ncbi:MAG: YkgJ family cysteine cluster protein [Planctomycetaceae bacterium]|nr:MAG: YkgJ family cysteine cluster protein [Planctomycetaceae bacterium]